MDIPDRKKWQALKAAAKPALPDKVSAVKLGELLDAYHTATKKNVLDGVKQLTALVRGCQTYKGDLKKKAPDFLPTFKKFVEAPVLEQVDLCEQMGNPVVQLSRWLPKLGKLIEKIEDATGELIKTELVKCVGPFHFVEQAADKLIGLDKANNAWMKPYLTDIAKFLNTNPATLADKGKMCDFMRDIGKAMEDFISELTKRKMYNA